MADFRLLSPAEIDSLNRELDIFTRGTAPSPELILKGLYPPLPICSNTLIWGFELLRSAKSRQVELLNCLLIPPCPRIEMLRLALKLENRAGSYSWPEKEKMFAFLAADSPAGPGPGGPGPGGPGATRPGAGGPNGTTETGEQVLPKPLIARFNELSPLIENHPDPQLAAKISTFSALPEALKELVAGGQIDLKTAARVQSLPEEVFRRIRNTTLTFSQSRQFLSELFEVGRKRKLSAEDIGATARQALQDERPLETIHRLRFPAVAALQQRFTALEGQLLGGTGVRLKAPPYYEGEAFTVEFEFNSAESLRRKIDALQSMEGRVDALFELLH